MLNIEPYKKQNASDLLSQLYDLKQIDLKFVKTIELSLLHVAIFNIVM